MGTDTRPPLNAVFTTEEYRLRFRDIAPAFPRTPRETEYCTFLHRKPLREWQSLAASMPATNNGKDILRKKQWLKGMQEAWPMK